MAMRAMEAIFRKARRRATASRSQLITDEDGVFKAPSFRALMQRDSIVHTFKEARNDISTVDRLIGLLRRALAQESAQSGEADWAAKLDQVVRGFNESPSSHLLGGSPADARSLKSTRAWPSRAIR
jgi:hypothetical protein